MAAGKKDRRGGNLESYSHLLIAKVKDTKMMFSFVIEASIIESSSDKEATM